jgi:hypothetical protein
MPAADWHCVSSDRASPDLSRRALPPGATAGDAVTPDSVTWIVRDVQPNGTGSPV